MDQALLQVVDLTKDYYQSWSLLARQRRTVRALEKVDLSVELGETVGLVGESGCGKSTLGRCLLRIVEPTSGEIIFDGENILSLGREEMRERRKKIQILYQNPYLSLNPRINVLNIVSEPLKTHTDLKGKAIENRVDELLEMVDMTGGNLYRYPHEFSGGQLQRIALARTLALTPKFVVLDEPTSALDVSVQANILNMLQRLQIELGLTYLFISHDLNVVQHISDRIVVMYLGRIVEVSATSDIFQNARHPYTQALLSSIPILDPTIRHERIVLEGNVPSPVNPPPGCKFAPRCRAKTEYGLRICDVKDPDLILTSDNHFVRCWLFQDSDLHKAPLKEM